MRSIACRLGVLLLGDGVVEDQGIFLMRLQCYLLTRRSLKILIRKGLLITDYLARIGRFMFCLVFPSLVIALLVGLGAAMLLLICFMALEVGSMPFV